MPLIRFPFPGAAACVAACVAVACLSTGAAPALAQTADGFQQWRLPATVPHPADNQPSPERVELGKMLFFEKRLSGDGKSSCVTCHLPELGWSDGRQVSLGIGGKPMARNSQSLINLAYNVGPVMWAGQKKNLEDQIGGPMLSPDIMATDVAGFIKWLSETPAYSERFAKAYPGEGITLLSVSKALANFERTIIVRDTQFDKWLAGAKDAMTPQQLRGLLLFTNESKGNCATCHAAPTFSDNGFHNIGIASKDVGRHKVKALPALLGAFKTPQLRGIAHKKPYMHNGSLNTLMDVVEHYNKGGSKDGVGTVSANVRPLNLSQQEKEDLVAFLQALGGSVQTMAPPPVIP